MVQIWLTQNAPDSGKFALCRETWNNEDAFCSVNHFLRYWRMCRLLAYLGPPIPLARFLTEPEHSLVEQAYQPREMTAGVVNADGFGVAWYDARRPPPYRYRNTCPIWSDVNLEDLGAHVESGHALAYVRSATPGQGLDMANTQPFVHGRWSFVHNGFVEGFGEQSGIRLRRAIGERLDDAHWAIRPGETDSSYLFAWLMQHLDGAPPEAAISDALHAFDSLPGLKRVGLNFLLSDGRRVYAVRHARAADCATLYLLTDAADFPGATLVASEPLFDAGWQAMPANSLTVLSDDDRTGRHPVPLAA